MLITLDIVPRQVKIYLTNVTLLEEIMSESTFETVRAVIAGVLKIDEEKIEMNTRFVEDLKADSMDLFFLIDGFTEKFGVTISDEDAQKIRSVADIVDYIDSHK